jgi:hypothetical protein
MRDRRARQRRGGDDRADRQALVALEHEQDALAVLVADRREHAGDRLPGARQRARIG